MSQLERKKFKKLSYNERLDFRLKNMYKNLILYGMTKEQAIEKIIHDVVVINSIVTEEYIRKILH